MEKYATYSYFKNSKTGEVVKIPLVECKEFIKTAEINNWEELTDEKEIKDIEAKNTKRNS